MYTFLYCLSTYFYIQLQNITIPDRLVHSKVPIHANNSPTTVYFQRWCYTQLLFLHDMFRNMQATPGRVDTKHTMAMW